MTAGFLEPFAPTMTGSNFREVPHGFLTMLKKVGVPVARVRWANGTRVVMSKKDENIYSNGAWGAPLWACLICDAARSTAVNRADPSCTIKALKRGLAEPAFCDAIVSASDLRGTKAVLELMGSSAAERARVVANQNFAKRLKQADTMAKKWSRRLTIAKECTLKWEKKAIRMRALASAREKDDGEDSEDDDV